MSISLDLIQLLPKVSVWVVLLLPLVGDAVLTDQVSCCLNLLRGRIWCVFLINADSNKLP